MGEKKVSKSRFIEYILVLFLIRFVSILPYRWASDVGGLIGRLIYILDKKHREITIKNLSMAFPGITRTRAAYIARKAYENIGRSVTELIYVGRKNKKEDILKILYKWTTVEGSEIIEKAFKKGKGVLLITGHFGNWELLGISVSASGYPLSVVARPLDNPWLNKILGSFRSITGSEIITKKGALREILRRLRKGKAVGILIDQNTSRDEGVFVDFMGIKASTVKGPALIALKSDVTVVPVFIVREGKYRHRITYYPEIPLYRSGNIEEDVKVTTQRFTKAVEDVVSKYPEQWLWMHRRWKTRPIQQ